MVTCTEPALVYTKMCPCELVATPTASPRYVSSGKPFSRFGVESYGISGTTSCANGEVLATSTAAAIRNNRKERLIEASARNVRLELFVARNLTRGGLQDDLLHAPRGDFRDQQFVLVLAIHCVDGGKLAESFAGLAEPPKYFSVQLHFVDLARDRSHVGRAGIGIRVRAVQVLVRARGDAHGPGRPHVLVQHAQRP